MRKTTYLMTLNILILCLVLSGLNTFAENISYTGEELNNLGANKFEVYNAIGVHNFNFSESGNTLESTGYIYLSNTYNCSVEGFCNKKITLSIIDTDGAGNPRNHTVAENVIFHSFPKESYIQLGETEFTIDPQSKYKISYKLIMPAKEAYESINKDINNGFLGYINIRTESEGVINVNYNYKIFSTFEGEYHESMFTGVSYISYIFLLLSIILLSIVLIKKFIIKRKEGIEIEAE